MTRTSERNIIYRRWVEIRLTLITIDKGKKSSELLSERIDSVNMEFSICKVWLHDRRIDSFN